MERNKGFRFSGGTSFMSNGYAIWRNGLADDEPNWLAKQQGETYIDRMFYIRSLDQRASFYKFVTFLRQVQRKEAKKERAFIELKLKSMNLDTLEPARFNAIQKAIDAGQFGLAYTLITERGQSIQELKEELKKAHFNNISHMNSFWGKQFSAFFERKFVEIARVKGEQLLSGFMNSNLTIDSLVDEWIEELMAGSDGVVMESLVPMRKRMKKELSDYFVKAGFSQADDYTADLFGNDQDLTSLTKNKTVYTNKTKNSASAKKRTRKAATLVREIAGSIGNAVGRGIAQEFAVTAMQGRGRNTLSFNTGEFQRQIYKELAQEYGSVSQKADVTSIELFNSSINLQELAEEVFAEHGGNLQTGLDALLKSLEEKAKQGEEIFQISTNVKGYRSKRDLQIEGEGSFKQRTQNLVKMAAEAKGLPEFSMEKLIFMLNNTIDGCIAENYTHKLVSYIAAVCVAWMWDDYTDLFSISEEDEPIQKIRMFNSGGFYYSASQIIKQTLDELLEVGTGSSFVSVEIKPPKFDANAMYAQLKKSKPVPLVKDKDQWQSVLAERWNTMRDYVASHGTVSIKFQQAGLERIIGKLEQYL